MTTPIEELLPFYALNALTASEKAQVEAYLAENPPMRAEVQAMQQTVALLPFAAKPLEPAAATKTALMQRVRADIAARTPTTTELPWPLNWFWARPKLVLAFNFVGLVALVLVTLWAFTLQQQVGQLQQQQSTWQKSLDDALAQIEVLHQTLSQQKNNYEQQKQAMQQQLDQQDEVLFQVAQPENKLIALNGTEFAPQAEGQLLVASQAHTATLVVKGLPQLPSHQVYQFWFIQDKLPVSGGFITLDEHGVGTLVVTNNRFIAFFEVVGISIEPQGGSPAPTGNIVILGQKS
jgi:anti-sigma-K factor RskA